MERIKHYAVNDLAYSLCLNKAIEKLNNYEINFNQPTVIEIIEIFYISEFFKDWKLLNEKGKKLLDSNKTYLPLLKKSLNVYFKNIRNSKISEDLSSINSMPLNKKIYFEDDYFKALAGNIDFANCLDEVGDTCLKYIRLEYLVENKDFVSRFPHLIKKYMLENPESFCLIVSQFDHAQSEHRYTFPQFSDDEINTLIEKYISSDDCKLRILELTILHKDTKDTYRIKRKTRTEISKKIKELKTIFFNNKNTISTEHNFDFGLIVEEHQKDLVCFKQSSGKNIISFSTSFLMLPRIMMMFLLSY